MSEDIRYRLELSEGLAGRVGDTVIDIEDDAAAFDYYPVLRDLRTDFGEHIRAGDCIVVTAEDGDAWTYDFVDQGSLIGVHNCAGFPVEGVKCAGSDRVDLYIRGRRLGPDAYLGSFEDVKTAMEFDSETSSMILDWVGKNPDLAYEWEINIGSALPSGGEYFSSRHRRREYLIDIIPNDSDSEFGPSCHLPVVMSQSAYTAVHDFMLQVDPEFWECVSEGDQVVASAVGGPCYWFSHRLKDESAPFREGVEISWHKVAGTDADMEMLDIVEEGSGEPVCTVSPLMPFPVAEKLVEKALKGRRQ